MRSQSSRWKACLVLHALMGISLLRAESGAVLPQVNVSTGVLQGLRLDDGPEAAAFLGVPFAVPPLGDLRWAPPREPRPWPGVRQAVQYSPACPQLPAAWLPYPAWSEDCLYLNIWTPKLAPDSKLPVIVYFHGGSNRAGYSQLNPLGPALSRLGIVVVTANYRLGPFGFFAHPALTSASSHHASGNYGILDQIQALRWVKRNIARFGGDPDRVTAMGQSAGAFDVCLMMASPLARGLFHQAILESGDCESTLIEDIRIPVPYNQVNGTGEGNGEKLAADLGAGHGSDAIRKLRRVSAGAILNVWSQHPELDFDAVVDSWVIPEQPARISAAGRQAHIPVLVGSNADEATVFPPGPSTTSAYWKYLRADTGRWAESEFNLWPAYSDAEVTKQYLKLQNVSFALGAWSMARAMSRVGEPAYLYQFTWADGGQRARLGACHGEELYFLSDAFPRNWTYIEGQEEFGQALRQYWTNFVRSGNPGGVGLPEWPGLTADSDRLLELGRNIHPVPVSPDVLALSKLIHLIVTSSGH